MLSSTSPIYIQSGDEQVFGLFDDAAPGADRGRSAVLICPPWGWEETASYRGRRHLALQLAARGHPTLRVDLPSSGNSLGDPGDPGRLGAWVEAVLDASAWLRESSGRGRLSAIGLGSGGLIAIEALVRGAAIDELALWAVPSRGKRFVREITSFAKLQSGGAGRGEESPLPEGWVEAGGFVLAPETLAELKALEPLGEPPARLRRALLLDRDGIETDADLAGRLEAAGVAVEKARGQGWDSFAGLTELPAEVVAEIDPVVERISGWLEGAEEAATEPGERPAPPTSEQIEFQVGEARVRETPFGFELPAGGRGRGVAAEPVDAPRSGPCVVFLNAGGIRNIGPSRVWVESARKWAGRGVASVRIDLEGIGEADGEPVPIPAITACQYSDMYRAQIEAALDVAQARGLGPDFLVAGLCSGGYWSFQIALSDPRVRSAVMLNPGALIWNPELKVERRTRMAGRGIFRRESWARLFRGEVDVPAAARRLAQALSWRARSALGSLLAKLRPGDGSAAAPEDEIAGMFDQLRDADQRIAMAFCDNEHLHAELEADGYLARLGEWPNIEVGRLDGEDHGLGPVTTQRSAHRLLDAEISRALAASDAAQVAGARTN